MDNLDNRNTEVINIYDYLNMLWKSKLTIILITILFGSFSILWSLSLQDKYTSSTLLMVNQKSQSDTGQANSQLAGIASLVGAGGNSGSGINRKNYATEIIKSKDFMKRISKIDNIKSIVLASNEYETETSTLTYNEDIFEINTGLWIINEPSDEDFYNSVMNDLRITQESTGFTKLAYTHISPIFAKNFLDIILTELNDKVRQDDLIDANNSIDYLTKMLKVSQQKEIKAVVSDLIEENLRIAMLANIDKFFVLKPLDPAFIPENRSSPARTLIVLLGLICGFISSIIILTFKNNILTNLRP